VAGRRRRQRARGWLVAAGGKDGNLCILNRDNLGGIGGELLKTAASGWDGDTGAVIVDGTNTKMSTAVQKWNTPIDANGRIVVGVNGQLYVFTP
jgi:hypothetical protein